MCEGGFGDVAVMYGTALVALAVLLVWVTRLVRSSAPPSRRRLWGNTAMAMSALIFAALAAPFVGGLLNPGCS